MTSKKKHMDEFLKEAFKHYIAIKDADYKQAQTVFNHVFELVKQKMSENDNFFAKYSSQVMNAGSVYDGIKVGKLDEFDIDIVIRLPISYDDNENGILIENHQPGFVKMKIQSAFDNLDNQPDWEKCHKVTRDWRDQDKYFLQSRFRFWMQSVVQKAVNDLGGRVTVKGVSYLLTSREAGPAFTLLVRNDGGAAFSLDVDLVPVIKFRLPRWPEGYRKIPDSPVKEWLVVPKPLKSLNDTDKSRCWRLAFHDYERDLIKGCELLKPTIRLMKKLRDTLELKEVASYYIKTLFLWQVEEKGKKYWQQKTSVLLENMVEKLVLALEAGRIPYYWHAQHNLLGGARPAQLQLYRERLAGALQRLRAGRAEDVLGCLLAAPELAHFRGTAFYRAFPPEPCGGGEEPSVQVDGKTNTNDKEQSIKELLCELIASNKRLESKFESLHTQQKYYFRGPKSKL